MAIIPDDQLDPAIRNALMGAVSRGEYSTSAPQTSSGATTVDPNLDPAIRNALMGAVNRGEYAEPGYDATQRDAKQEALALKNPNITKEYIDSRGGINAAGYYIDVPLYSQLTLSEKNSVTLPDGRIDTQAQANILLKKEYDYLISTGLPVDMVVSRLQSSYGYLYNSSVLPEEAQKVTPITGTAMGGTTTGGTTGGSTSGMITQADLNKAVADAIAAQQVKFDAIIAQQAADKQAEITATKTKAKDKLTAMLSGWNLQGLASWIDEQIMNDISEEMIFINLYEQAAYKERFPGMEALRKAGRTITEDEYIRIENQMIQTARFFDLPKGFYDSADDFGKLIGNQVSAKEYQDRLQIGQDLARSLNPSVKQQLVDFYGVGEGDLTAYVLDPERALSLIQKQTKAAQFVGLGRAAGFTLGGITAQQAESIVGTEPYARLSEAQLQVSLGQAAQLRREQQRLSQIEGMTYNEQEALDAVIGSSPEALLASQQRAQREVARFSARGGITGSSLATGAAI
jgi:hypothetical protein